MVEINYTLIILAAFLAVASPGPATLAIAGTSMSIGRLHGSVLAFGILTGSFFWSCSAAFGLSAIMHVNVWLFEIIRYIGACYLLFLAFKATCSALSNNNLNLKSARKSSLIRTYLRGFGIHLTNPKAILFFGSLYAIGIPVNTTPIDLVKVITIVGIESLLIFQCYAYIFSTPRVCSFYISFRRSFETLFAVIFGMAGIKVLSTKLDVS